MFKDSELWNEIPLPQFIHDVCKDLKMWTYKPRGNNDVKDKDRDKSEDWDESEDKDKEDEDKMKRKIKIKIKKI